MKSRKRSLDTLPSKVNNEEIELCNINKGGNLDLIEEETDVLSETEKIAHCDVGEENHDEEENSNEVQENSDGEYLKTSSTGRSEILNEDHDTSDEEDLRNTVGNIPMKWYEDFVHIGYNLDGKTITKPIRSQDELDKFLDKMENPDYWRTVHDEQTASKHVLSEEELQIVSRLKSGAFYDGSYDPYEAYVDFFTHEKMLHPISNRPEHKRSFIPSLNEKRKVGKIVHAIKMGWLKLHKPKQEEDSERKFYDLWADSSEDQQQTKRSAALQKMHIPPPKPKLPGHEASYNPPEEYLPTPAEIEAMKNEEDDDDVITDKFKLLPTKYDSLRQVPQYQHFIQERFARSLDLYLCPRQRKMKVNVNPDDLIPDLPRPSDLRPFPTFQALCYHGHKAMIRTISVDPTGQWLASGSDDGCVNVWEVATARCVRKLKLDPLEAIKCAAWCPNVSICLFAVAVGKQAVVMNPCVGDRLVHQATDQLINSYLPPDDEDDDGEAVPVKRVVDEWTAVEAGAEFADGKRLIIRHPKHVSKVEWHGKGDYFATTMPGNGHQQVLLHQLTKRRSQNPFNKLKGQVQCVAFHPTQPLFFVATQRYVRVYNLMKQELTRKLLGNSKWISSIAVHPGGDNLLVGSYDCRLSWFDMDLSSKPFATMRYHKKAIRACCFHRKYPLFASAADDATVVVGHGMVYNDLLQNPLIVPVKVLKGHRVERNVGVLDCCFHPTQPWLFSSAADHVIRLFT